MLDVNKEVDIPVALIFFFPILWLNKQNQPRFECWFPFLLVQFLASVYFMLSWPAVYEIFYRKCPPVSFIVQGNQPSYTVKTPVMEQGGKVVGTCKTATIATCRHIKLRLKNIPLTVKIDFKKTSYA